VCTVYENPSRVDHIYSKDKHFNVSMSIYSVSAWQIKYKEAKLSLGADRTAP